MPDNHKTAEQEEEEIHNLRMSRGIVSVVDRSIDVVHKLIMLIPKAVGETIDSKLRDLEEQLEELHDTAGQIDESLDQLRERNPELSEKERQKLHKELSCDIRRYVYLTQKRIKGTYEKLQRLIARQESIEPLPDFPTMEMITIHTDAASGIDMRLLTRLLRKPLSDLFLVIRWIRNRLHCFACGGSLYAPHLPKGRCPAAINFDNCPPPPAPLFISPVTVPLKTTETTADTIPLDEGTAPAAVSTILSPAKDPLGTAPSSTSDEVPNLALN